MPTDIDFNRIESDQKNIFPLLDAIKTEPQTWSGLKTFNIISTPKLDDISGDITLGGIAASSLIKGRTYIIEGRSVVFSASAFNAARVNVWSSSVDSIVKNTTTKAGVISGNVFSRFDGNNLRTSLGGSGGGYVLIINTTTGVTIINNANVPAANTYWNCGIGNIYYQITPDPRAPDYYITATIAIRRCKYPISEDDPITAYDTNYNPAPSRKITLADIDAFRVG